MDGAIIMDDNGGVGTRSASNNMTIQRQGNHVAQSMDELKTPVTHIIQGSTSAKLSSIQITFSDGSNPMLPASFDTVVITLEEQSPGKPRLIIMVVENSFLNSVPVVLVTVGEKLLPVATKKVYRPQFATQMKSITIDGNDFLDGTGLPIPPTSVSIGYTTN